MTLIQTNQKRDRKDKKFSSINPKPKEILEILSMSESKPLSAVLVSEIFWTDAILFYNDCFHPILLKAVLYRCNIVWKIETQEFCLKMSSILRASGSVHLETLEEFAERFPQVSFKPGKYAQKIWISHLKLDQLKSYYDTDWNKSEMQDYSELHKLVVTQAEKDSPSMATDVFNEIYNIFKSRLTHYIFAHCHLFYNWGMNAFEPLLKQKEIHKKIASLGQKLGKKKKKGEFYDDFRKIRFEITNFKMRSRKRRAESPDLFEDAEVKRRKTPKKRYNPTKLRDIFHRNDVPFREIIRNPQDPTQQVFNLNPILYDMKQRTRWRTNDVLSSNNVDDLIKHIANVKINAKTDPNEGLVPDYENWKSLKSILESFLRAHNEMNHNNGYNRILRNHLMQEGREEAKTSGNSGSNRQLTPIPKTMVSSFVIDILRRVLPLKFFGSNNHRKKFTSQILRIIGGYKEENFIWFPFVRPFLENKHNLDWCREVTDDVYRNRMIFKTLKWLIGEYIFGLLRNNFYVTETGSSNYGLRFYKKNDMDSSVFATVNDLLYYYQIRPCESDDASAERRWIDTGRLEAGAKPTFMPENKEYQQKTANVRFLPKNDRTREMRLITNIVCKYKKFPKGDAPARKLMKSFMSRMNVRRKKLVYVKMMLQDLIDKYGRGIKPLPSNPQLEAAWRKAVRLKEGSGKLYVVKADIADAFGSVRHTKLNEILQRHLSQGRWLQLKRIQEWRMRKGILKKTVRFSFSDRPKENSVLISRSALICDKKKLPQIEADSLKDIIRQIVFEQKIKINGKVFRMVSGLAQGSAGKFSTHLCEIYYSAMDDLYFDTFLNSDDTVLLRGVDDYLLLTSDFEKANRFYDLVCNGISDFNARFNREKLISNINSDTETVDYLGLKFNVEDMSVIANYSKYEKKELLSTMKLSDSSGDIHFRKTRFLERRTSRIISLKLQPILLNNFFNKLSIVRLVVFEACLMQANRVLVLTRFLFNDKTKNDLDVCVVLIKSLNRMSNVISGLNQEITVAEIRWLFFYAVNVVFERFSGQFADLLAVVQCKLDSCEIYFKRNYQSMVLEFLKSDISFSAKRPMVNQFLRDMAKMSKPFNH